MPLAFVVILHCVTFDEWSAIMYNTMRASSPYAWIFFVVIGSLGGFYIVNLFLAVIFKEFVSTKIVEAAASEMQDPKQRELLQERIESKSLTLQSLPHSPPPSPPKQGNEGSIARQEGRETESERLLMADTSSSSVGGLCGWVATLGGDRLILVKVADSASLSFVSTSLVLANILLMCLPYYDMPDQYEARIDFFAGLITNFFIVEMIFKLLAYGCAAYWADQWNALDGTIVLMSVAELIFETLENSSGVKTSFLRVLRILRVLRMLRLMRRWRGLYKVVNTFGKAIPQVIDLFSSAD